MYQHSIELKSIQIANAPRDIFREQIEEIPYRGYEVEHLSDGRKIVIAKPGGKTVYGTPKKEDFIVFVYNPTQESFWQISHKQIYDDLEMKAENNPSLAIEAIEFLERVYQGEEPDQVLKSIKPCELHGESIEVLLKSYKWIWGQEDANYPKGEGRDMSMKEILKLKNRITKNP